MLQISYSVTKVNVTVLFPLKYFCTIRKLMNCANTVTCMFLLTSLATESCFVLGFS